MGYNVKQLLDMYPPRANECISEWAFRVGLPGATSINSYDFNFAAAQAEQRRRQQENQMDMPQPEPVPTKKEVRTEDILTERGKQYGAFVDHASATQNLKTLAYQHANAKQVKLSPSQKEALDMIFHKIGRIVNGNPNHTDSWDDIAGYAKLEADIQRGIVR